jgi:hypothetical protein
MKKFGIFILILLGFRVEAQDFSFRYDTSAVVRVAGKYLANAWAGGLNATQFSTIDLNADGQDDLVTFDRTADQLATFLAVKQGNTWGYRHAPAYENLFPKDLENWMLLADADADGRKDLFTFTPQGIRLFRNEPSGEHPFSWKLMLDPILTQGFAGRLNLYVASSDIPAIVDVDNDGDVDILAFDASGNYVEYHKNFSQEETGKPNALIFKKQGFCWGDFIKEHCRDFQFNIDCQTGLIKNSTNPNGRVMHSGNSLLVLDLDGDARKDVLFGHITCPNLAMLPNSGTVKDAKFASALYDFPVNQPANFKVFPAVYYEDVDFDGRKDLLVAPNAYTNEANQINFRQSNWFYKNAGSNNAPLLSLQQTDFLQNTMLDVGEFAAPALLDLDGDGDLDLLVGTGGTQTEQGYRGSIWHFKNTGSKTKAQFELQTTDFLNIGQSVLITEVRPFVADMNADGVPDVGFTANSFKGLEVRYLPNQAPRGEAFRLDAAKMTLLPLPSNVRNGDHPLFVDVDKDGVLDLLVGKSFGFVEFYRNVDTATNPAWTLTSDSFGGIEFGISQSLALTAADLNADGKPELWIGNGLGDMRIYPNFREQVGSLKSDNLLIYNLLNQKTEIHHVAGHSFATAGDLDGDQLPELLVGGSGGGIRLLRNTSKLGTPPPSSQLGGVVYPNPTSGFVYLNLPYDAEAEVYNMLGQALTTTRRINTNEETGFDLSPLSNGLYLLKVRSASGTKSFRVLVKK